MVTWKTDVETAYIVLIISDQPETAASWNTLFTQRNCIVLVESEVSDAIQSARLIDPSLVVIDVHLTKTERAALLTQLRANCRGHIMMLISANTVDEILEANRLGADECLVKPVNSAVLIVKAMAWLGHGHRIERLSTPISVTL
jgi:two-component system, OmpR family, response regulator AdeR